MARTSVTAVRRIRLLPIVLLLTGCAASPAATEGMRTYSATSERIGVMGRHLRVGNAIDFGAAGVTFYFHFSGSSLDVELEERPAEAAGHDWFTVVVDGGTPRRVRVEPNTRRYTLARELGAGEHRVVLSKATEGLSGHERLLAVHASELLPADPLPTRRIEFVGNSITVGYGADPVPVACTTGTWYDASHSWLAYGPIVARRVNAQWMLSAVSGIGILRNWNSPGPVMAQVYDGIYMEYADTLTRWDYTRYTPDLVVVALGTNDFSDGAGPTPRPPLDGDAFVASYVALVTRLRAHYPGARILLIDSPMLDEARKTLQAQYLVRVLDERAGAGDTAIARLSLLGHFTSGCDGHPDLAEQAQMADQLESAVRSLMKW